MKLEEGEIVWLTLEAFVQGEERRMGGADRATKASQKLEREALQMGKSMAPSHSLYHQAIHDLE